VTRNLTVGEQIVLLALDEQSGKLREVELRVALAVAAAGLLEEGRAEEASRKVLLAAREAALDAAFQGLVEKGIVSEQGRRVLGAFGSVKHPVIDSTQLVALKTRISAVLVEGQEPDEETAALITLLRHSGLTSALPSGGEDVTQEQAAALGDTVRSTVNTLAAVIAATAV